MVLAIGYYSGSKVGGRGKLFLTIVLKLLVIDWVVGKNTEPRRFSLDGENSSFELAYSVDSCNWGKKETSFLSGPRISDATLVGLSVRSRGNSCRIN